VHHMQELNASLARRIDAQCQTTDELGQRLEERDLQLAQLGALGREHEQVVLALKRAKAAAGLHEKMAAELADAKQEIKKFQDEYVYRYSTEGWAQARKDLASAYRAYWKEKDAGSGVPELSLEAVQHVCDQARCKGEYDRVKAQCGKDTGTTQYKNKVKKVVAMWINSIEVASQRCNAMQRATAISIGKTSGSAKRYMSGAGMTTSERTAYSVRAELVQSYHTTLADFQAGWAEAIEAGTDGCLVGWMASFA